MSDIKKISSTELASFLLAGAALLLILHSGLLAALYSGLLVYALVHLIAPALSSRMSNQKAKLTSVAVLGSGFGPKGKAGRLKLLARKF